MRTAIFPGSFDPFTRGHAALVEQALDLFDKVVIAIGENVNKNSLLDAQSRERLIRDYYTDNPNTLIDITEFEELKMDSIKCHVSQAEPALLAAIMLQQKLFAEGTDFRSAEPLRMLSSLQMHCFNLPVA